MKAKAYHDLILLISLGILPLLVFIHPFIGKLDEVIFIYMVFAIIFKVSFQNRDILFPFLIILYLFYSIFLIIYNSIPLSHIMQIFVTSKFLIIFLYFYANSDEYKTVIFKKLMKFIIFIFMISVLISILQFIFPSDFHGYSPDGRGFMGINAGGIFFGRISYSSFLVIFIILLMSIKINNQKLFRYIIKYRYTILIVSLLLLFLTFARKEMVIGYILLIYLFKDKIKTNSKIIFYLILSVLLVGMAYLFILIFQDLNNRTFIETQIRYLMLMHSLDIFSYYFPFGSGPGTYGSIMSLDYTIIYEKFDVARHIYLGYGDDVRGPIFDLYLFGLLAEYGMGIIFIFLFLKKMAFSDTSISILEFINAKKLKISLVIHLFIVSIFVPIFANWVGFLIFTLLGVMSTKGGNGD